MLARALTLPADGLILDLEDAVAPDRKAATRGVVREWLGRAFGGRVRSGGMESSAAAPGPAGLAQTTRVRPACLLGSEAQQRARNHALVPGLGSLRARTH